MFYDPYDEASQHPLSVELWLFLYIFLTISLLSFHIQKMQVKLHAFVYLALSNFYPTLPWET